MTTQYKFDFSRMTLLDVHILASGDILQSAAVLHRVTVGGAWHLPASEVDNILRQFSVAFRNHMNENACSITEKDDDAVRDMLDGIEGL